MIEALRSPEIETIVAQHPWFENDCLYADIVLPSNTKLEEEDFMVDHFSTFYNLIVHEGQCVAWKDKYHNVQTLPALKIYTP